MTAIDPRVPSVLRRVPRVPSSWVMMGLAAAALASPLAGCDDHRRLDDVTAVHLNDPEKRHPIRFASREQSLDVEVPPGAEGLSPNQRADVALFLDRYRREAQGRLILTSPASSRDRAALARSLQDVQSLVADAGIDYRLIPTHARERVVPSIRIAYRRPVAIPPHCNQWPEDVGRNEERLPYPNWGCATQHNYAVMVDNARDFQTPQPEDPRSSERRSATWSSYVGTAGGGAAAQGDPAAAKSAAPSGGSALKK